MGETIETNLFEICFSKDRRGKDNKFNINEIKKILEAVKKIEDALLKVSSFSRTSALSKIYRTPVIFEKVSIQKFLEKHTNHQAMTSYPLLGLYGIKPFYTKELRSSLKLQLFPYVQ